MLNMPPLALALMLRQPRGTPATHAGIAAATDQQFQQQRTGSSQQVPW